MCTVFIPGGESTSEAGDQRQGEDQIFFYYL